MSYILRDIDLIVNSILIEALEEMTSIASIPAVDKPMGIVKPTEPENDFPRIEKLELPKLIGLSKK